MSGRFPLVVWEVTPDGERRGPEDYVPAGEDLLVPRAMGVAFVASIQSSSVPGDEDRQIGSIEGLATIENGVASIFEIKVSSIMKSGDPDQPDPEPTRISDEFLKRVSMVDLGLGIVARCSLTRWQEAHYALEPAPRTWLDEAFSEITLYMKQVRAIATDAPRPVRKPPKPVFTDADGIPWYEVQVIENVRRGLPWRRNARITPEFLRDLWLVYGSARQAGEPTTEAVREWAEARTGRVPSNPTIFRWIKEARAMYGEGSKDA